jgi:hypothetical protein
VLVVQLVALLAVLAEAQFILHGWLRSGNTGASRGVVRKKLKGFLRTLAQARLHLGRGQQGGQVEVLSAQIQTFSIHQAERLGLGQLHGLAVQRFAVYRQR